jgi:uncharacterized protein YfiM (DUF2279 family)
MDLAGVAIAVALLLGAQRPIERPAEPLLDPPPLASVPQDRWLAEDKYRHFFISFGGTVLGYGAGRSLADADAAAAFALGAGAAAGLAKELLDRRAGGAFSLRDLAWDGLGLLAAWGLIKNTR